MAALTFDFIKRRPALSLLGAVYVSLSVWMLLQEKRMRLSGGPGIVGPMLEGGQLAAAACDVAENTALLAVLRGRRGNLPAVGTASAILKFSLLGAGAGYIVLGMRSEC